MRSDIRWSSLLLVAALAVACSAPAVVRDEASPASSSREARATALLLADIRGVLRPCGCKPELQRGGFDRLVPLLERERGEEPVAVVAHAGPLFFGESAFEPPRAAQWRAQAALVAQLVRSAGLGVAGAAALDVDAAAAVGASYRDLAAEAGVELVSANLTIDGVPVRPFVLREAGGLRVAVLGVTARPRAAGGVWEQPAVALPRVLAEARVSADAVLLLSDLGLAPTKALLRAVPGVDFAVAGGLGEAALLVDEAEAVGGARVIQLHREGRLFGRLQLCAPPAPGAASAPFADGSGPSEVTLELMAHQLRAAGAALTRVAATSADPEERRHEIDAVARHVGARLAALEAVAAAPRGRRFVLAVTPVDWSLPQDGPVLAAIDGFLASLDELNCREATPPAALASVGGGFTGGAGCATCHEGAQRTWAATPHARAWQSLVEVGRRCDPECVPCHVTGFGQAGGAALGFVTAEDRATLPGALVDSRGDVQCEACHGPGGAHVVAGGGALGAPLVASPEEAACRRCHTEEHAPGFDYRASRERILGPGHGRPERGGGR